eukprot:scaffold11979_cov108-Isochrysis_galbana.AAC.5
MPLGPIRGRGAELHPRPPHRLMRLAGAARSPSSSARAATPPQTMRRVRGSFSTRLPQTVRLQPQMPPECHPSATQFRESDRCRFHREWRGGMEPPLLEWRIMAASADLSSDDNETDNGRATRGGGTCSRAYQPSECARHPPRRVRFR